MLYHITLRHRPVDCPGRNPEKARELRVHFAEREGRQRELGYKIRTFVGAWPSHTEYALVEAPDLATVHRWTRTFPNHDEPTVCPVKWMAELITNSQNTVHVTSDDADSHQTNAMEFHLTMEHSSQYCPAQNPDLIRALRERYDQREQRSKETGVRVRFFVSGEPTHVAYALLKADSVENVRRWLMKYPVAQDIIVTPVQPMATLLSSG